MRKIDKLSKLDKNGNEIYRKYSNGLEYWYNENNKIHIKNPYGVEYWREYDEYGNEIHYKDSDGEEYWKDYDNNGNLIHIKNSNGYESWKEYDENNNLIHFKNSYGEEYWKDYEDGKHIECRPDGYNDKYIQNTNDEEKEQLLKLCDEHISKVINIKNKAIDNIIYLLTERCYYKQEDGAILRLIFKGKTYSICIYQVSDKEYNKLINDNINKCVSRVYENGGEELLNKFVNYVATEVIPNFVNKFAIKDFNLK